MRIEYTDEQCALRAELREYFSRLVTPEIRPKLKGLETGPLHKQIIRQMLTELEEILQILKR